MNSSRKVAYSIVASLSALLGIGFIGIGFFCLVSNLAFGLFPIALGAFLCYSAYRLFAALSNGDLEEGSRKFFAWPLVVILFVAGLVGLVISICGSFHYQG